MTAHAWLDARRKLQPPPAPPTARRTAAPNRSCLSQDQVLRWQQTAGNAAVAQRLAVQRYEVQDCGAGASSTHPATQVHAAHGRARTMASIADMESATSNDPTVQALARKYFKITVPPVSNADKKLWFGRVRQVLTAMSASNSKTTYECEPAQSWTNGLCTKGSMAVTLLNIHLCPEWWNLASLDDRAFVLLHEWAHRYGPSVNQVFETYCDAASFGTLPAGDLVAEPDAYAGYIFELVTGGAPSSAVC